MTDGFEEKGQYVQFELESFYQWYNREISLVVGRCYGTTSRKKLTEISARIETVRHRSRLLKLSFRDRGNEDGALEALGMQSIAEALRKECQMWTALKDENAALAWSCYVSAFEWSGLALRTRLPDGAIELLKGRYERLEETLFPRMMFVSTAFERDEGVCNICRSPMSNCKHVPGHIYLGQVCCAIGFERVEVEHVAIVQVPEDKHCYVATLENAEGRVVDCLTGDVVENESEGEGRGRRMGCVAMTTNLPVGAEL